MVSAPDLRTPPRKRIPSMHTFALRDPWYWERLRWLKKWTIDWTRGYVRAEGPPGTRDDFVPVDAGELFGDGPPIPMVRESDKRTEVQGLALAEAVSSEDVKTGKHHILIDIDRPCALIPSSSEGHFHLYVQMGSMGNGMEWENYAEWLRASAKVGLIEQGYAEVSIRRKATFLRLPWIRKGHEQEDRQRALGWWMDQPEGVDTDGKQTASDPPF